MSPSYIKPREFTAAEVELELKSEADVGDELSPVQDMLHALHRRLVREQGRISVPCNIGAFGNLKKLAAAGIQWGDPVVITKERPL